MFCLGQKKADELFLGEQRIGRLYLGSALVHTTKIAASPELLEYLETTDQQTNSNSTTAAWIDTGVIPDDNTVMEIRMAFTTLIASSSGAEALCGATGGSGRFAWGFANVSPRQNFYVGLGGQNLNTTVARDTNVHTFKIDAVNKTWAIDDASGTFTASGSITAANTIFLFARNNGNAYANKPANARIYYCKIWDKGTLIRDFVPALDTKGVACMYDKVSGKYFYKQGTGEFGFKKLERGAE